MERRIRGNADFNEPAGAGQSSESISRQGDTAIATASSRRCTRTQARDGELILTRPLLPIEPSQFVAYDYLMARRCWQSGRQLHRPQAMAFHHVYHHRLDRVHLRAHRRRHRRVIKRPQMNSGGCCMISRVRSSSRRRRRRYLLRRSLQSVSTTCCLLTHSIQRRAQATLRWASAHTRNTLD